MTFFVRALALLPLAFLMAATAEVVSIADYELMGSCTFQYQWTGETCMEFRGTSWTVDSMSKRCDAESDGVWNSEACGASEDLAGFCIMTNVNDNDDTAIEATAMMITPASDCVFNKMACENFMSGSFEDMQSCSSGEEGMTQTEAATETETTSASTKPNCDESLTAPVKLPCPATPQIMVSYDESTIDCADAISVEDAASVPTVRVVAEIEDESVYSLLLVDTSESPVHPILHYGALNIKGALLKEGFILDNSNVTIFSGYRGPNPPKPDEMWSTPQTQQTMFVYEYMLSKQPNGLLSGGDLLGMSTMSFDYEAFFEETIGSSFDESNIMSTYFRSGRCNFGDDKETASSNDILIESFDNPQFLWESVMVDNMDNMGVGGNWDRDSSLTWNFTGYNKTEFSEINNYEQETFEMDMMGFREEYYETIRGSKMEIVDDTLVFTANISSDTFDMMGSSMMMGGSTVNMVATNARGVFPDLRSCDGLKIVAKQQQQTNSGSSSEQEKNDYYDGFKIDIGYTKLEGSVFGYGYRASLNMMGLEDEDRTSSIARASSLSSDIDNDGFQTVIIPFEDFTLDWDWNTGEVVTSCQEDEQYCIDEQTLKDMETFTITALGSTNGVAQELHIQSIAGTGCDDSATTASSSTEGVNKDDQWTCSSIGGSQSDEILIETFTDPSFGWITQNDPVMGGESYSSVTMMEEDGAAFFTGEIKDVPFLGVPGFIQMEARGGVYPDASCCTALKLNVMGMEEYAGYRVSFGTRRAKTGFFAQGFKADFDAPVNEFGDVIIPFDMFSVEWDEATGDQIITCAEDPTVCPDMETLKNMETMAIWGEGVGGKLELYVKSISVVGCSSSTSPATETNSGFARQDTIDAWKARNSGDASSSSSVNVISFLFISSMVTAISILLK